MPCGLGFDQDYPHLIVGESLRNIKTFLVGPCSCTLFIHLHCYNCFIVVISVLSFSDVIAFNFQSLGLCEAMHPLNVLVNV